MSELLIGMLIGFAACWYVIHITEASYERRHSVRDSESASVRQKAVLEGLLASPASSTGQSLS
jgi:hypothetical protein